MTTRSSIEQFLAQRSLGLVGVSRGGKKFGNAVHGECILMSAQPAGIHRFHHFIWKLFDTLPAGAGYATLEIRVNLARPVQPGTVVLRSVGRVVHRGRRTALTIPCTAPARGRSRVRSRYTGLPALTKS